jgi:hypothetical protein
MSTRDTANSTSVYAGGELRDRRRLEKGAHRKINLEMTLNLGDELSYQ